MRAAIDNVNSNMYIYFSTTSGIYTQGIYRANLDASNRVLQVDGDSRLNEMNSLTLNPTLGQIVYARTGNPNNGVYGADMTGEVNSGYSLLALSNGGYSYTKGVAVDQDDDKIYYAYEIYQGNAEIWRCDSDGSNAEQFIELAVDDAITGLGFVEIVVPDAGTVIIID